MVAIHATRSADTVPFLHEVVEQATTQAATGASADGTETCDDNTAPTGVRFVLAVTGGIGGINGNSGGGGAISAERWGSTNGRKEQRAASTAAVDKSETMGEDRGGRGPVAAAAAGAEANPRFYTVEGRPDVAMLRREVPDIADRHVLLCGPDVFMAAMDEAMKELGVPSSRIHSEDFYF